MVTVNRKSATPKLIERKADDGLNELTPDVIVPESETESNDQIEPFISIKRTMGAIARAWIIWFLSLFHRNKTILWKAISNLTSHVNKVRRKTSDEVNRYKKIVNECREVFMRLQSEKERVKLENEGLKTAQLDYERERAELLDMVENLRDKLKECDDEIFTLRQEHIEKTEIRKELEKKVNDYKEIVKECQEDKGRLKLENEGLKTVQLDYERERAELLDMVENFRDKLKECDDEIFTLRQEHIEKAEIRKELEKKVNDYKEIVKECQEDKGRLKLENEGLKTVQLDYERERADLQNEVTKVKIHNTNLEEEKVNIRMVKDREIIDLKCELTSLKRENEGLVTVEYENCIEKAWLREDVIKFKIRSTKLEEEKLNLGKEKKDLEKVVKQKDMQVMSFKRTNKRLKTEHQRSIGQLEIEIERLQNEITELQNRNEEGPFEPTFDSLKDQRIAKVFGRHVYFGTIIKINTCDVTGKNIYGIEFEEDDDYEDQYLEELKVSLDLYKLTKEFDTP